MQDMYYSNLIGSWEKKIFKIVIKGEGKKSLIVHYCPKLAKLHITCKQIFLSLTDTLTNKTFVILQKWISVCTKMWFCTIYLYKITSLKDNIKLVSHLLVIC